MDEDGDGRKEEMRGAMMDYLYMPMYAGRHSIGAEDLCSSRGG
jgi:hypothetical protein